MAAQPVVADGDRGPDAVWAFESRDRDRVHQNNRGRGEPVGNGAGDHDRPEGVSQNDGIFSQSQLGHEIGEPGTVIFDAVRVCQERVRLAKPRKIRADKPDAGELSHDGFDAVVVAAVTVHQNNGGGSSRGTVLPVPRVAAENSEVMDLHRNLGELSSVGGFDCHHAPA